VYVVEVFVFSWAEMYTKSPLTYELLFRKVQRHKSFPAVCWRFGHGSSRSQGNHVVSSGEGLHLNASLTYMNSSGGTQQENFYGAGPFEIEVHKVSGDFVYISAQLKNEYLDTYT